MSADPTVLVTAHAAVELSMVNLRGWILTLDGLPDRFKKSAEEMAIKRSTLDGLVKAERALRAMLPHEDAIRDLLRERTKGTN